MFISYAREVAPELTSTLSSADEKSAERFFHELRKPSVVDENLFKSGIPILLWAGTHDPYYIPMAELAKLYAIPLVSGKGDHLSEVNHPDKVTVTEIINFIQSQEGHL